MTKRYGLSVVLVLSALLVRLLVRPETLVGPVFLLAVILSAWLSGVGPGLVAALVATLTIDYFFLPPKYSLRFNPAELPELLVFLVSAVVVSVWSNIRNRTERLLRRTRDELEERMQERSAELSRSNGQLKAEIAVRERVAAELRDTEERFRVLSESSLTGVYLIQEGRFRYVNPAMARMFGYTVEEVVDRLGPLDLVSPDDRPIVAENIHRWVEGEVEEIHYEIRGLRKDGSVFPLEMHGCRIELGGKIGVMGTLVDNTEGKRAELERQSHLRFLEGMDRVNQAMQGTNDLEQMMSDVLEAVLSIFGSDRAWLVYPCDPQAPTWRVAMEHTRPEFPGAFALQIDLPVDPEVASVFETARSSSGAVRFDPGSDHRVPVQLAERFSIRSMIAMVLSPKIAQPYLFGLHQCSGPRVWTPTEERLFQEIGRRLEDALTSVLIFRSLRDSERRLEEAQRIAHVGYWDRDLVAGRITLSDEGARIFGLQPEERILDLPAWHERWQALIHPEDRSRAAAAAATALAGGPRYDVEYRVVHRTGEVRFVHSQGDVIRDASGRPIRMFGIMQDITERKRAEAELRASEERFRTLVQFSFDVYWESDAQHRFTRQEFAEGLADAPAPGSEIGKTRWEVPYLEPDEAAWREHRATLDAHLPFRDFELARPAPDGGKRYVSVSGLPVFDETGRFLGYRGVGRHITDRKRSEHALRKSQAYLAEAQRLSHTGSWSWSPATRQPLYWSEEMFRIFDLNPQEGVPTSETFWQRIHPEDLDRTYELLMKAMLGNMEYEHEHRIVLPDGTVKHIHAIGHPVLDENGQVAEYVGTAMDVTERKRAEEALRQSERYLAEAQRLSHTGSCAFDVASNEYVYVSEEFLRIFGIAPDTVWTLEPTFQRIHPDDQERVKQNLEKVFREKADALDEYRIVLPDGTLKHIHVTRHPVLNDAGNVVQVVGTVIDITERKRAEEALRQSQAYLAEAERLSHTGSWAFHVASNKYVYASEECLRIFELDAQGGLPTREAVSRLIHPEDWDRVNGDLEKSLREKVNTSTEFRITLPSGTPKHIQAIRHPVLNSAGDVATIVGTVIDITERKRAEEALRRSEAYLAEGQRLSHAGSWAWNPLSEQCFYWSEEMFRIFEIDPQQGLPTSEIFWARIHPEDRESMRELLGKSALEKTEYVHDHRILLPDGTVKHIHAIGHPVLDENGQVAEYVGTAVDVTDRKRAEEERETLRQLEAELAHINRVSLMGELASSIAHEVNQPLSGVVSNANACLRWLAGDAPNLEEVRETARRIVRDGKRAAEVIARIRALAKRAETPKERLDLNETMREVLVLVGDEAKREGARIHTDFADDLSPVAGDQVQLQQVVLNLVMNGIEAMSSVGERARELMITTRNLDPDQVQVTVDDSGIGLDPDVRDKIFAPFYTTKPGGMGMGLSICRSILEAHGGRLWATAKDGPGAVFHFTLPRYHEEASNA